MKELYNIYYVTWGCDASGDLCPHYIYRETIFGTTKQVEAYLYDKNKDRNTMDDYSERYVAELTKVRKLN